MEIKAALDFHKTHIEIFGKERYLSSMPIVETLEAYLPLSPEERKKFIRRKMQFLAALTRDPDNYGHIGRTAYSELPPDKRERRDNALWISLTLLWLCGEPIHPYTI